MKHFLIVVDMQKDFVDGALGTEEAVAIVPNVVAKIKGFDGEIFATLDTHYENYMQTNEGKHLPVPHCIKNTEGWRIRPEVMDALGNDALLVEKPTFGSVRLPQIIGDRSGEDGPEAIELLGLCTDICVVSNVMLLKAARILTSP